MGATTVEVGQNLEEVSLQRVEAEITQWAGNVAAGTAVLLGWIAEYDRRAGWQAWGCQSMAHWLSWKCGDGLHAAREKVRVARALESLPTISAAFASGELSFSKVRAITRVATPVDEHEWLVQARSSTGFQLERMVAATRSVLDRDEDRGAREAFEKRAVTSDLRGPEGRLKVRGPADEIDTVNAALDVVASRIIDDAVAGTGRTRFDVISERGGIAAVRHDALVQIAERALAADPAAAERGDIGRLQVALDTDAVAELNANLPDPARGGEQTLSGRRIAPEVVRRWTCDIRASVALEHNGHACDEGRTTRIVNRRLRRALLRRDHGVCRFPGCGTTQWLHAHHIVHWTNDGETNLENLLSLCSFHHHLVHEGGWTVELLDDQVAWSDPAGMPATIDPLYGSASEAETRAAEEGVGPRSIESQWANDRLDFGFVVSVLVEHIQNRERRRPRGDVAAGTPAAG